MSDANCKLAAVPRRARRALSPRCAVAKALLIGWALPPAEIVLSCNFWSQARFTRARLAAPSVRLRVNTAADTAAHRAAVAPSKIGKAQRGNGQDGMRNIMIICRHQNAAGAARPDLPNAILGRAHALAADSFRHRS